MKKLLCIIALLLAFTPANLALGQDSYVWDGSKTGREGIDSDAPDPAVRRFWSETYKGHFYTADTPEANNITANMPEWTPEGTVFYAIYPSTPDLDGCAFYAFFGFFPIGNCKSVYRFWSDTYKHHFYTISEIEKNNVQMNMPEWQYEGVSYAALTTDAGAFPGFSTPLYRFWSNAYRGHFYTASEVEKNNVMANMPEWQYEGVAYYVIPSS